MNFSDLFVVLGMGAGLYGILVAMTRQQRFLAKAVNPHRLTWLITGFSVLWVGMGLMRVEAESWSLNRWLDLLAQLVSEKATPGRVKIASVALFFGLLLIGLVVWCVLFLPRDPSTFHGPRDRRTAFRYYVQRLRGGLDFALLGHGDGECLEEAFAKHQIQAWCENLPKVKVGNELPRARTADDQLAFWRQLAASLHKRMREVDALVGLAHQGHNRRLVFDCEYGGLFFFYLRTPDPTSDVDTGLYLFGATLNQTEVTNGRAEQHFRLLLEALNHIDRAIRIA